MKRIRKASYYSKVNCYGCCLYIMVNDEKGVFCKGVTCLYLHKGQLGPRVNNLTYKQLNKQAECLLELGYTEIDYKEYYSKGYKL